MSGDVIRFSTARMHPKILGYGKVNMKDYFTFFCLNADSC